ncbi:hypothetical protein HN873_020915, partial [Arachis hypogaea]
TVSFGDVSSCDFSSNDVSSSGFSSNEFLFRQTHDGRYKNFISIYDLIFTARLASEW